MSLHRTCCCDGGGGPSRLWLSPSLCNDDQPATVIVFEENDCNLILNSQLYEYDDGSFFGGVKYCGVLRREVDFPIPSNYNQRDVDASDCDDIEVITCGECFDDLCAYWNDCDEPSISVDGFTDTGWQFPDDGFGQTNKYRARITDVSIGAGTWKVITGIGMCWEYDLDITCEAELLDAARCENFPGPYYCNDEPLEPQTWTWTASDFKLRVFCDFAGIGRDTFEPQGPYVCENANTRDGQCNPVPYRDVSAWHTRETQQNSSTSTLAPTEDQCVFEGSWSVTQGIDIGCDIKAADGGFDDNWRSCVPFNGLFLNAIDLTISGTYL